MFEQLHFVTIFLWKLLILHIIKPLFVVYLNLKINDLIKQFLEQNFKFYTWG